MYIKHIKNWSGRHCTIRISIKLKLRELQRHVSIFHIAKNFIDTDEVRCCAVQFSTTFANI